MATSREMVASQVASQVEVLWREDTARGEEPSEAAVRKAAPRWVVLGEVAPGEVAPGEEAPGEAAPEEADLA